MMYKTKKAILDKASEAKFKTFGEIDKKGRLDKSSTKGQFGHIIEESLFEYEINSKSEPDFIEAGVELKVTPFKQLKKGGYSSKERLVLGIINYMKEYKETFYTSSFWKKNHSILMMFYLYEIEKIASDLTVYGHYLYEYPEDDLVIIKMDWEIIMKKIRQGKAHEISEADTIYLAACTKGKNRLSVRPQPFSEVMAPQRAYSFKQSYMTEILNKHVMGDGVNEKIIKNHNKIKGVSFREYIINKIRPYFGKSREELKSEFHIDTNSYQLNSLIISKIFGVNNVSKTDEFLKANIKIKTIKQEYSGTIKESMSFPAFKYTEITKEEWETSTLREMFETTIWLFVVFKRDIEGILRLHKAIFWNMPIIDLDTDTKVLWEDTVNKINYGNIFSHYNSRGNRVTSFINSTQNRVGHVRQHGRNSADTYILPVRDKILNVDKYTKSCFWLNSRYIKAIINT